MLRKLGVLAVSLVLVLVTVPATAHALRTDPPVADITDKVSGTGGKDGNDDGGGGGGGGGGYVPPPLPEGHYKSTYFVDWTPPTTSDTAWSCARMSDGRYASGYVVTRISRRNGQPDNNGHDWNTEILVSIAHWCKYPLPAHRSTVVCPDSVAITGERTGPAPTIVPATIYGPHTVYSAWHDDKTNADKCASPSVANSAHIALDQLGEYKVSATTAKFSCQRYDYPGTNQPPEIRGACGGPFTTLKANLYEVWCDDWAPGHSGTHSFTMAECTNRSDPKWSCNKPSVTLDGFSSPVAVLDDGKGKTATWTPTTVTGNVQGVGNWKTQVKVLGGSTPSRDGVPQKDPKQKYQAPDDSWPGGDITSIQLRWFAPSMPTQPWKLSRSVSFDGQFQIPTVVIDSMNLETGVTHAIAGTPRWVNFDGVCESDPLEVKVSRARNFR